MTLGLSLVPAILTLHDRYTHQLCLDSGWIFFYLSMFPLDILKMDRSLLAAGAAPITSGIASAVLSLGETFELEVVAEGIEHPEQWDALRDLGCDTGQGFYFARPMGTRAPDQVPERARRRRRAPRLL